MGETWAHLSKSPLSSDIRAVGRCLCHLCGNYVAVNANISSRCCTAACRGPCSCVGPHVSGRAACLCARIPGILQMIDFTVIK